MKHLIIVLVSLLLSLPTLAQRGGGRGNIQRVQEAKISYLTDRIHLTDKQAERFWPLYHQYEGEVRAARRKAFTRNHNRNQAPVEGNANALRTIEARLAAQEEAIEIQRKYKVEFLRILSAEQLLALYDAEREFNRMVLQRVRQQRGERQRR